MEATAQDTPLFSKIPLQWEVGYTNNPDQNPRAFYPATVPGAVHLDWAAATNQPVYWKAENYKTYQWIEKQFWLYQAEVSLPTIETDQVLVFDCGGVDYCFKVRINGESVHQQEGMFTAFEIDLSNYAGTTVKIEILIEPVPDSGDPEGGRTKAKACAKPAVGYGWDWHPELNPVGIWKETCLCIRPAVTIANINLNDDLNEDLSEVDLSVSVQTTQSSNDEVMVRLFDPNGELCWEEKHSNKTGVIECRKRIENPLLWWPNEQGPQNLYTLETTVVTSDGVETHKIQKRMGFRRVRLVMHEGAWDEPSTFPKSRSNPPITMEINGRRIFCKGSNWVPPEIFPGTITSETYEPLLQIAKKAHFNILRSWGGGIVNKACFFERCDELGLMVWQDFPLACNCMSESKAYLDVLDQESRTIIQSLKHHACVVIWCGGNELFNSWSKMTDQHLALRLLNRNCFELDPQTPFIPTSPISGMAHGHYLFYDEESDEELFELFANAQNTAYTEYGCPGPAHVDDLKTFIPEEELFPPQASGSWLAHHGFDAWRETSWLHLEVIEHYFGRQESIETIVQYGQLLQSQGFKFLYEEARRQKPRSAMALNWCFNEPWPTAANNSLLSWPARPKPALQAVSDSCRPISLSAAVKKFQWLEGETFECEIWVLNDHFEALESSEIYIFLQLEDEKRELLRWTFPDAEANQNIQGPTARCTLPKQRSNTFDLFVVDEQHPERNTSYTLAYLEQRTENHQNALRLNH